jgi:hypothetical protein
LCKVSVESEVIIGGEEEEEEEEAEQTCWWKYPTPIIFYKIRKVEKAEHILQHLTTANLIFFVYQYLQAITRSPH